MSVYPLPIVFICPPKIKELWGFEGSPIRELFDGDNLKLLINRENYTPNTEGDISKFRDYATGQAVDIFSRRLGFTIDIKDQRQEIFYAMRDLARFSTGSVVPGNAKLNAYVPVTVHDYHVHESKEDYVRGYAIRKGKIMDFGGRKGVARSGKRNCDGTESPKLPSQYYGMGFSVTFVEQEKRNSEWW